MITLTYKQVMNDNFVAGIRKIGACGTFGGKTLFRATKIIEALQAESHKLNAAMAKLRDKHQAVGLEIPEANKAAFLKDVEELGAETFTIHQHKLPLAELSPAQLAPFEMIELQVLIEDGEVVSLPTPTLAAQAAPGTAPSQPA